MPRVPPLFLHAFRRLVIIPFLILFALFGFPNGSKEYEEHFAIVIDAGSTGSRIHVYSIEADVPQWRLPEIHEVGYAKVKPGLSSFADNPQQVQESLRPLLEEAMKIIPVEHRTSTAVHLLSTAGFRLLPAYQANDLLEQARLLFETYPFAAALDPLARGARVLRGTLESINGWTSLWYYLRQHSASYQDIQIVTLDMGGASTQIALPMPHMSNVTFGSMTRVRDRTGSTLLDVYRHSFLRYGLVKVYDMMLKNSENPIANPCMGPDTVEILDHQTFKGVSFNTSEERVEECAALFRHLLFLDVPCTVPPCSINGVFQPRIPPTAHIFGFAKFYDRLSPFANTDGFIKVSEIGAAAQKVCGPSIALYPHRLCGDLIYLWLLLGEAYGLDQSRAIHVIDEFVGFRASWALAVVLRNAGYVAYQEE